MSSDQSEDQPLARKLIKPPKATAAQIGDTSSSDTPLGAKLVKQKEKIETAADKKAKAIRADERKVSHDKKMPRKSKEQADDDAPAAPKKKAAGSAKPKRNSVKKEESDDDDIPLSKKVNGFKKSTTKSAQPTPVKKGKAKVEEPSEEDIEAEEQEEEYKWWEDPTKGDGTQKWATLEHSGLVFPPPYKPLPASVKLVYDGVPVSLKPEAEEIATFYGAMLNSTVNVENPTFNKNFFIDFKEVLDNTGHAKDRDGKTIRVKEFVKCDFKPIFEYFDAQRAEKKALPAAEKKALKAEKDAAEAPYLYCIWDGRKQKVGNFRVEPPGLFRGRGEHPKTGKVKKRVQPEQITINIGKEAMVPAPPEGHRWKDVKHDQEGTWLAMWQENVNNQYKYVMLAANSDIKGQSDFKKFEKARELKASQRSLRVFRVTNRYSETHRSYPKGLQERSESSGHG